MRILSISLALSAVWTVLACVQNVASGSSQVCITTVPPAQAFTPPSPYWQKTSAGGLWYGSPALWTLLNAQGIWKGLPFEKTTGYHQKLLWFSQGFDWRKEASPSLMVTGKRLDGDAPAIAEANAQSAFVTTARPGIMTAIDVPTSGCWEITGHYGGHTLSFVVDVEP